MRKLALLLLLLPACGSSGDSDAGPRDAAAADATTADAGSCAQISCSDFDLSGGAMASRYDATSHVMTLVLKASAAEVTGGSLSFLVATRTAPAPSTKSALLTVSGKSMSVDLSQWLVAETSYFGGLSITAIVACGSGSGSSVISNMQATAQYDPNNGVTSMAFSCLPM